MREMAMMSSSALAARKAEVPSWVTAGRLVSTCREVTTVDIWVAVDSSWDLWQVLPDVASPPEQVHP